jgi:hypothetical protein
MKKIYKNLSPETKLSVESAPRNVRDWAFRKHIKASAVSKILEALGKNATIAQAKAELNKAPEERD